MRLRPATLLLLTNYVVHTLAQLGRSHVGERQTDDDHGSSKVVREIETF